MSINNFGESMDVGILLKELEENARKSLELIALIKEQKKVNDGNLRTRYQNEDKVKWGDSLSGGNFGTRYQNEDKVKWGDSLSDGNFRTRYQK